MHDTTQVIRTNDDKLMRTGTKPTGTQTRDKLLENVALPSQDLIIFKLYSNREQVF